MKKGIIIIAIGIMLLAIDIRIPMGELYPSMDIIEELGEVIQGKIINNLIGRRPMVDLISDLLGYVLLFVGSLFLLKYNKKLLFGIVLIPLAIFLYITILQLPYHFILGDLYLKAAGYHFLMVILDIIIELSIIRSVISIVQLTQTKWNVNELLVGLVLAMISKGILSGIHFFFSRGVFYNIYSLVLIGATIYYLNRLYVITKFKLEGTHD